MAFIRPQVHFHSGHDVPCDMFVPGVYTHSCNSLLSSRSSYVTVCVRQVVQGYKDEDIIGDACDQATYHNAIAMLGLIHQKVRLHLAKALQSFMYMMLTHKASSQVFNQIDKAEQLYKVVLRADPDHVLTLDHRWVLFRTKIE
jgi:hypothetical protein